MAPARCAGASHQLPILGPAIVDPRSAWAVLPPLLKGYRRLGAMVGDGAVIDEQFNTTDVCVVLPTGRMAERYRRRYRAIATLVRWRERCSRLLVAAVRTAALLGWTGLLLVPCIGCHALGRRAPALVVRAWHSGRCTIVRLRVRVCGAPSATGPTLSVANHVSYLDIVVLGSLVNAGFIAKVEVATWPLLGWIARIGRTVFIERRGLRSIGQRDEIAKRLATDESLILFPEGTSSDGSRVLPFEGALFAAAGPRRPRSAIKVQPVTISYVRLRCGPPIDYALHPLYAW